MRISKYKKTLPAVMIFFFSLTTAVFSQNKISSINEALKVYKSANIDFAGNKHDDAISKYKAVDAYLKTNPEYKRYFDHYYRNFSITEIVEKHKNLGKIKPQYVHNITAVFIRNTDASYKNGKITGTLSEDEIESAKISQQICSKYLEVMTHGKVSFQFTNIIIDAAVTRIEKYGPNVKRVIPDVIVNSIRPYPSEIIYKHSEKTDTFIFYFKSSGNSSSVKYSGPYGWGGINSVPVIPETSSTPLRGRIVIGSGLMPNPGTHFHELFHTIEKIYGIDPIHGFYPNIRKNFPDWKGNGEFDYYQYHLSKLNTNGQFSRIAISDLYKENADFKYDKFSLKLFNSTNIIQMDKAINYYYKGLSYERSAPAKALKNYKAALNIYPSYSDALAGTGNILYTQKKYSESEKYISKAYSLNPNKPEICYLNGLSFYRKGNNADSISMMTRAIELNRSYGSAYLYRGFLYFITQSYEEAQNDFLKASSLSSSNKKWIINYLKNKKDNIHAQTILQKISVAN